MSEKKDVQKITVPIEIKNQVIKDILCTATEASCGYWARWVGVHRDPWHDLGQPGTTDRYMRDEADFNMVLANGGWIIFATLEDDGSLSDERYNLTQESVHKGIKVMAEKYSRHFSDFMNDNHDSITADVFLQCCLFGEVVYG